MSDDPWHVTTHARTRAKELGYTINELHQTATDPQITYEQPRRGPNAWIYQRGDCAIGVNPNQRAIITVLLRRATQWTHGIDKRETA